MIKNRKILTTVSAALAACLVLGGCAKEESSDAVSVQSVAGIMGIDLGYQNKYMGQVISEGTEKVERDTSLTISEVYVEEGDSVKAGQALFSYDTQESELAVSEAELELEQLQSTIDTSKAQIEELTAEQKSVSEDQKLSYTIEIQELEITITKTEYDIKSKESEIEELKEALEDTEVVASIDGIVTDIATDQLSGDSDEMDDSSDSSAFITITEVENYRVQGTVSELNVGDLYENMPVTVRSRVDETQVWSGYISEIDTDSTVEDSGDDYYDSDTSSGATDYPFYVTLDTSDGLMMGQHVYIEPGTEGAKSGIWISSYFVIQNNDGAYVWAAGDGDKLEKRSVTLGEYDSDLDEFEITEGLSASDYIAIPEDDLAEGMDVAKYDASTETSDDEEDISDDEIVDDMDDTEILDDTDMDTEILEDEDMDVLDETDIIDEDIDIEDDYSVEVIE